MFMIIVVFNKESLDYFIKELKDNESLEFLGNKISLFLD